MHRDRQGFRQRGDGRFHMIRHGEQQRLLQQHLLGEGAVEAVGIADQFHPVGATGGSKVRRVFLPTYDLPILDGIAKETYEKQGFEVIPLNLAALTSWRGAIRCISNVLDRQVTDDQQTPPTAA